MCNYQLLGDFLDIELFLIYLFYSNTITYIFLVL